jgi:hypothetical protein
MLKKLLFITSLLMAGAGDCQSLNPASDIETTGVAADLATTAIGLTMGAAEANPLGLAVFPLKLLVKAEIDKIPDENQRREASAQFSGAQFAAAAANICTLAAANPAVAAVCFAGGAVFGYNRVKSIPTQTDCFNRHLAQFQEAAATGRVYRVVFATCRGQFEASSRIAAE